MSQENKEKTARNFSELFISGIKVQFNKFFQDFDSSLGSIKSILSDIRFQTKEREDSFAYTKAHRLTTTLTEKPLIAKRFFYCRGKPPLRYSDQKP